MEKRWRVLWAVFLVMMGLLACRAAYIQLAGHEDLTAAAKTQQQITLEGADTRGIIYDRNGTPIVGAHKEYIYIIEKENYDGETQNALNSVYAEEVPNEGSDYKVFTSALYSKTVGERLIRNSEAYILEADRRYSDDQSAVHIIGYVNPKDKSGASGLELMYDDQLSLLNRKVSAVADVQGKLLQGYGLTVTTSADDDLFVKDGITTTLELGLQKKAEQVLSECANDGAVVVTDCSTGQIMAAASTPVFDPSDIETYIDSDGGELINKITQGEYPPGSIFKIVVAAAALEAGYDPDMTFFCSGSETVNGHTVKCNTGGESGHGQITLEQAFAYSCNCAFVQLGQKTGAAAVIEMAEKLGLGETVLDGYPGEKTGNLMTLEQSGGAAIANLSIGQGETLVTPLQIAHLTATIANGGVDTETSLIMNNELSEGVRCMSEETAEELQKFMEATVEYGTGSGMEISVSAGAKTGSAESTQSGSDVIHGWMTGYIPADDPEYVITVFMEDGKSGRTSAGPVFAEIAEYINEKNMLENEIGF